MATRPLAPLTLLFLLSACGDAPAVGPGSGMPRTVDAVMRNEVASALALDVDDDALEELLSVHRQVLEAGADIMPLPKNTIPGTSWTYARYGRLWARWKMMQHAVGTRARSADRDLARIDAQIGKLQTEAAAADAEQRSRIEAQVESLQTTRKTIAMQAETLASLATPETKALVATWQPRFEALEAEYDE